MSCWRRVTTILVLMLTVVGVLAHICVLPLHAHASDAAAHRHQGHDAPARAHPHDADETGGIHPPSCEALRATSAVVLAAPSATVVDFVTTCDWLSVGVRFAPAPPPTGSPPPLYLVHRALLI